MTRPRPRPNADRMGYGKPLHEMTEAERATRRDAEVHAATLYDCERTDLPGRHANGRPVPAGMHEAFAGQPRSSDTSNSVRGRGSV